MRAEQLKRYGNRAVYLASLVFLIGMVLLGCVVVDTDIPATDLGGGPEPIKLVQDSPPTPTPLPPTSTTMTVRTGGPTDTPVPTLGTYIVRLDLAGADSVCTKQRLRDVGEFWRAYEIQQAVTYQTGTWQIISDWKEGTSAGTFLFKIIVTDAAGVEQRVIHSFGNQSPNVIDDFTLTAAGVAQQTLTATERLALHIGWVSGEDRVIVGNMNATCDTRLVHIP